MQIIDHISEAMPLLRLGKVIAYPTEAVYGLGCDPYNQKAVEKILLLKQRSVSKGLIILISEWFQLDSLIEKLSDALLDPVRETWPGPVTWIFPKSNSIPSWLSGNQESIAIRMSAHPIARALCQHGPIVSTSANLSGEKPATSFVELCQQFPSGIDAFLTGDLGGASQPSAIYEVLTRRRLR